jgi:putative methyltransferase (TIGR04325 family)
MVAVLIIELYEFVCMLFSMQLKLSYTLLDASPSDYWAQPATDKDHAQASEHSLAKAREMLKVKTGEIADIRDGQVLGKPQYQFEMLSSMLRQALVNNGKLTVLDVGGMLGTSYFQFLRFARNLSELLWCIVELPPNVEAGKEILEDQSLKFFSSIDSCIEAVGHVPDVTLLSGVLQNVPLWQDMLVEVCELGTAVIVIDRLTTAAIDRRQLCLQTIERGDGSITICPLHIIPENEIHSILAKKYALLTTFPSSVDSSFEVDGLCVDYKGHIWLRKE